jgi:hypothetical protein
MDENKSAPNETAPEPAEKPVYPIYGAHDGQPEEMIPTRSKDGNIRWIPVRR